MANRRQQLVVLLNESGQAFTEFSDDFDRADGAVGNSWQGTNIAISGNRLIITPTLGAEKLTGGDFEGAYTAGLYDELTSGGSPTVSEETSDVNGGSSAQEFTAAAFNDRINFPNFTGDLGAWFEFSIYSKRIGANTGGSPQLYVLQTGGLDRGSLLKQGATYEQTFFTERLVSNSNQVFAYAIREMGSSNFVTMLLDDASFKQITLSSMFALRDFPIADGVIKAQVYWHDGTLSGLAGRVDSSSNPQNGIVVYIRERVSSQQRRFLLVVDKVVNGTWSNVYTSGVLTYVDGAQMELHMDGSTINVWWNGTQYGGDLTVSDASILNNKLHGLFSSNDNSEFDGFFLSTQ